MRKLLELISTAILMFYKSFVYFTMVKNSLLFVMELVDSVIVRIFYILIFFYFMYPSMISVVSGKTIMSSFLKKEWNKTATHQKKITTMTKLPITSSSSIILTSSTLSLSWSLK
jgi:hypothetical protein